MDRASVGKCCRFILKRLLVYPLVTVSVLLISGYCFMEKLLLPEVKTNLRAGNAVIRSGGAELDVFYHAAPPGKPVILFNHGNAETLQSIMPLCQEFIQAGYGVLAYDYAGYGFSGGKASEKQLYIDAESVYTFLVEKKSVPAPDIIVMGFSVGGAAGCFLAEKHPEVRALVLLAPFASAIEVMLPFPLPGNRLENYRRLQNTPVPVLIFHGTADRIIPIRNSRKLYRSAAARRKKLIEISGAGHNNILDFLGRRFYRELADFTAE